MSFSAFIHVQHLLGTGHVVRAAAIGQALARRGVKVTLASGNLIPPTLDVSALKIVQLPPVRAKDAHFDALITPEGVEIDENWREQRLKATLEAFASQEFDLLLSETYPFGRRQFVFELEPLLQTARARGAAPLIATSIRDILVRKQQLWKEEWMADHARAHYDRILVHSDPDLIRLEDSFPFADRVSDLVRYTGFVGASERPNAKGVEGVGEVIVSCGGGAVGQSLLEAALHCPSLTRNASELVWRLLVGHDMTQDQFLDLQSQAQGTMIVERARSDFPDLLKRARLSISQAGYNTVLDILNAGVPSVLAPFSQVRETEQQQRADALVKRGRVVAVRESDLTPKTLAHAVDETLKVPPQELKVRFGGADASAEILLQDLQERAS